MSRQTASRALAATRRFATRAVSLGRMSVILAAGKAARLGTEKLVVVPVLLPVLGETEIGRFVWLLSWVTLIGQCVASGCGDALLRLSARTRAEGLWPSLLQTGMLATATTSLLLLVLGAAIYLPRAGGEYAVGAGVAVGLGAYLVVSATRGTLHAAFRVELQFGRIAVVEALAGAALLAAIPLGRAYGLSGMALGFFVSGLCAFTLQLALSNSHRRGGRLVDVRGLSLLLATAPGYAIASLSGIAYYHAGRITLGLYGRFEEVAIFFAAESIVALGLVPLTYVANVVYSHMSRKRSTAEIGREVVVQYIIASCAGAAAVVLGLLAVGGPALRFFYASLAEPAWPLLKILVIGAAAKPFYFLSRGFVFRFCSFRLIIAYALGNLLAICALLLVLVPREGVVGAAWAVTLANLILGAVWFGTFLWTFFTGRSDRAR